MWHATIVQERQGPYLAGEGVVEALDEAHHGGLAAAAAAHQRHSLASRHQQAEVPAAATPQHNKGQRGRRCTSHRIRLAGITHAAATSPVQKCHHRASHNATNHVQQPPEMPQCWRNARNHAPMRQSSTLVHQQESNYAAATIDDAITEAAAAASSVGCAPPSGATRPPGLPGKVGTPLCHGNSSAYNRHAGRRMHPEGEDAAAS
jgi:hypothetical protein